MSSPFPTSITPAEKNAGFRVIEIESEYNTIFGTPEMWEVVAKKFTECDYLFKISEGRYRQMRYGYKLSSKTKKPEWTPVEGVSDFEFDPNAAFTPVLHDLDYKIITCVPFGSV